MSSFSHGLLALVEDQSIFELNAFSAAEIHRTPQKGRGVLSDELDRLVLPFDGRLEVARLGARGGKRVDAVRVTPVGELAGLLRLVDGPLAIAKMRLVAGRQNSREGLMSQSILGL